MIAWSFSDDFFSVIEWKLTRYKKKFVEKQNSSLLGNNYNHVLLLPGNENKNRYFHYNLIIL